MSLTPEEMEELDRLRQEFYLRSLGDRPSSPAASKIRRKIELEKKTRETEEEGR